MHSINSYAQNASYWKLGLTDYENPPIPLWVQEFLRLKIQLKISTEYSLVKNYFVYLQLEYSL